MHLVTWKALRDELMKIARILPSGKFLPDLAKGVAKKVKPPSLPTARPAMLQYTPGKSTAEMAEWMGKHVPGYRAAAQAGSGPEIRQTALERLGVGALQPGKTGRFMRPPSAEEAQAAVGQVQRVGGLNRQLTESIQASNRAAAQAQAASRGPLGIRSTPAGGPPIARLQAVTATSTPQALGGQFRAPQVAG